jgi:hypothetical protein
VGEPGMGKTYLSIRKLQESGRPTIFFDTGQDEDWPNFVTSDPRIAVRVLVNGISVRFRPDPMRRAELLDSICYVLTRHPGHALGVTEISRYTRANVCPKWFEELLTASRHYNTLVHIDTQGPQLFDGRFRTCWRNIYAFKMTEGNAVAVMKAWKFTPEELESLRERQYLEYHS